MNRVARCVLVLALAPLAVPAIAAAATLECKADPAPGVGRSEADAKNSWSTYVTNRYGASWADINQAKNWHQLWNPVAIIGTWSAIPCRQVTGPARPIVVGKPPTRR